MRCLAGLSRAIRAAALACLALVPLPGGAVEGEGVVPKDVFTATRPAMRFFGEREGLPSGTVYALMEDRRGRLWVGTQDGAARYSGREWIPTTLPREAATNFIRSMAETPDGAFWFSTETSGLWRLDRGAWSHVGTQEGLPSDRVNGLWVMEEPGGAWSLFAGTSKGIARLRDGQWRAWSGSPLPNDWVWKFSEITSASGQKRLLACTLGGLTVLDGESWVPFLEIPGLEHQELNDLKEITYPDGRREWWVGAWGKGVVRWDGRTAELLDASKGFPSRFPVTICASTDKFGEPVVWIGTYDAGLVWFSKGQVRHLDALRGIPSNGIYSVLASRSTRPSVWVGFRGGGIAALDASGWYSVNRHTGLPSDEVFAFAETRGQAGGNLVWIALNGGIARFEDGRWIAEDHRNGLPTDRVQSLCPTRDGKGLWAGTTGGIAKREGGRWRSVPIGVPLKDGRVLSLLETTDERGAEVLWAGTESGLVRKDASGWRLFRTQDGLPTNLIYTMKETRDDQGRATLWLGTRGGGVVAYRDGKWRIYGRESGLPNLAVYGLIEHKTVDGRHWLWASTFGGGAARLELANPEGRWEVFSMANLPGLPSDTIARLTQDAQGRIYLATQRGVARVRFGRDSLATAPVGADSLALSDGVSSIALTYGAILVDQVGFVWVATTRGAAVYNPQMETQAPPVAPMHLDSVRAGGRIVPEGRPFVFSYKDRPLVISFGLSSYHREEETQYQSQLLGTEKEPTPWGKEGRREMTALAGGSYTLRIWARDYLGRLSDPLDVAFEVKPAPWFSPWAFLVYFITVVGGMILLYQVRMRMLNTRNQVLRDRVREATSVLNRQREDLERLNQEKNRFLGIAAHDLRSPLNTILLTTEAMADECVADGFLSKSITRIQRSAEQMTTLIGNLLEINVIESGHLRLNPVVVDLRVLVADAQQRHLKPAAAKGLKVELSTNWEELSALVDVTYFNSVMDNLLSNAIKFTPQEPGGRAIEIRASREGSHALIEVADQGPGLTAEDQTRLFGRFAKLSARPTGGEASTGLGLSIVKSVVESMQGRIWVESKPGQGATFKMAFPLARLTGSE